MGAISDDRRGPWPGQASVLLEERAALYQRLANRADGRQPQSAERYQERADNTEENARVLREFPVQLNEGVEV